VALVDDGGSKPLPLRTGRHADGPGLAGDGVIRATPTRRGHRRRAQSVGDRKIEVSEL
jgi:hypothetical protein